MDDEDPTVTIARLREQITQTRKDRMSAQRTVATSGVLEVALKRTSRDRSSGATGETDALREEIAELRDSIVHEVRQVDRTRTLFLRADAEWPDLPQRARVVAELNREAQWRTDLQTRERWQQLRVEMPTVGELD
ncbi:hypothetical protein [Microbacterium sp. str. 'China']|uniref:hypothetical protein n=1 Tax=Microbacterium sp. str. 'China' TaxID=2103230 RepID=UPI001319CDED|nr:hypothetical protein [Microbacterium sp. str. 'China']